MGQAPGQRRSSSRLLLAVLVALASLTLAACGFDRFGAKGWSGITLVEEGLVVGTTDGWVIAYGPEGGEPLWKFAGDAKEALGAVYSPPQVANGLVYVGGYDNNLYALELQSGNLVWKAETEGPIVGGPAVAGERVVVGSSDGKLYAFDARQGGNPLWTFPRKGGVGKIWSTPAVHEDVVYVGTLDHRVYAVTLDTGEAVWSQPFEAGGAVTGSPVVLNGRVYVGSSDRYLYALDAATGRMVARVRGEGWFWSGPVTDGTLVYAGNLDGTLYAWDGASSQPAWRFETEGPIIPPPALVEGDRIAVGSDDGTVYVLQKGGQQREWTFLVGKPVRASLAVSGEIVYVSGTDNYIRALDTAKTRQLWSVDTKGTRR